MLRRLRPWIPLVLGAVLLLAAASAAGLSAIESASKGPAFRLAATCLRVNGPARRLLGVVTGSGFTVEGSVIENADGTGSAKIDFHVNGSWRGGHIHMRAVERRRVWHLAGPGVLHIGSTKYRIDLADVRVLDGGRYSRLCAPLSSTTRFPPT
jgi:Cytochrome oxidase complex assembly protein 1